MTHQKSCTATNPSSRSVKEKNFSARSSIENALGVSKKSKYIVEEEENTDQEKSLPKRLKQQIRIC